MITISANTETLVPFTLFEKTTIVDYKYFINLFSNQNHNNNLFWLTGDTTNNNARYNYFPMTIDLELGTYDYTVYQTQSSATTFNLSAMTISNVVETGSCKIIGDPVSGSTYNSNKIEYTFY